MTTKAPRWNRITHGFLLLRDETTRVDIATIDIDGSRYLVKTRNRAGGWNYGYSKSLRAAKRKAKAMMREEAT